MQKLSQPRAIVVGAGILGLAYARSLSLRGYSVDVFERSEKASGSSIRNFGMVWPIGQPHGRMLNRAMKSREIWVDLCKSAKIWAKQTGSLQLLSNELEFEMGKEFLERESTHRPKLQLLDKQQTKAIFPLAHKNNRGAIFSGTEVIVEAREAIRLIPAYLEAQHGVKFHFNTPVVEIANGFISLNTEFKRTFISRKIKQTEVLLEGSFFTDNYVITQKIHLPENSSISLYDSERWPHSSTIGLGGYIVLNRSGVISMNYSIPLVNNSHGGRLYIGAGFMF